MSWKKPSDRDRDRDRGRDREREERRRYDHGGDRRQDSHRVSRELDQERNDRRNPSRGKEGEYHRPSQSFRDERRGNYERRGESEQRRMERELAQTAAKAINRFSDDGNFLAAMQRPDSETIDKPQEPNEAGPGGDEVAPSARAAVTEAMVVEPVLGGASKLIRASTQGGLSTVAVSDVPPTSTTAPRASSSNQGVAAALRARLGMKPVAPATKPAPETMDSKPAVADEATAARQLLDADMTTRSANLQHLKPQQRPEAARRDDYQDGQRVKYFKDDNDRSLQDLVREERMRGSDARTGPSRGAGAGDLDDQLARSIAKRTSYKGMNADDEYDHNMGVELLEHKGKAQKRRERAMDQTEQRRQALQMKSQHHFGRQQKQQDWLNQYKHLIVAFGNHSFLMAPPKGHLVDGHCYIVPAEHRGGTRTREEGCWQEVRNFKKCVMAMAQSNRQQVIFIESAMHLGKRQTFVEAIPVPPHVFKQAPLNFKKAIDEAESEWSQHAAKKLIDTSMKGLRGSIPPNFPYFHVEFGLRVRDASADYL